jgi:two-component system, NtrC family, response regulator AtoC
VILSGAVSESDEQTESLATLTKSACLTFITSDERKDVSALANRTYTVGRAAEADICLQHRSVSRIHAIVEVKNGTISIEDQGSANGVRVGSSPIRAHVKTVVDAGVSVEIGTVLFVHNVLRPSEALHARSDSERIDLREQRIAVVARSNIPVLIIGETGSGKDVLATQIHAQGLRRERALIKVNCSAIAQSLIESELFGHERGAFTGAHQAKVGLIEAADGGTLFLDEVGELPLDTQAKLLRVLEDGQVQRVGSVRPKTVSVRVIAATNRDLKAMVAQKSFREDLFFRLDGISLVVPPLRARKADVQGLADGFLLESHHKQATKPTRISPEAMSALRAYAWPGNIRELRNVLLRSSLLCTTDVLELNDLRFSSLESTHVDVDVDVDAVHEQPDEEVSAIREDERDRILRVLSETGGNQSRAAELLGIARRTLVNRMVKMGLPRPRRP